jgi:HEPN domain-containing protein
MNRTDLHTLVDLRVADANALLGTGRYAAAYYIVGYAVECALKACIAKQIKEHDFPDRKLILDSYTHNLEQLLAITGLKSDFDARIDADKIFEVNWTIVKDWSENARYDATIPEVKARDLVAAVTDHAHGVLAWLKTQW